VQKYERKLTAIHRNLVKDVSVVTMQCLAIRRWLLGIKGSGISDDLATDGEAALVLDHQRLGLALPILLRVRGGE